MSTHHVERLALAKEIVDILSERGHQVPADWAGPELAAAVARALDSRPAVALGRRGGLARSAKMSAAERSEAARLAAMARWGKAVRDE